MKQRLLPVLAALLLCSWSISAFACEHEKKTTAAAKSASVSSSKVSAMTADAKASCTPAQAAACKAGGASAAHMAACAAKGASAAHASVAPSSACKAFGASIVTASADHCGGKTTSATAAKVAAAGSDCCAGKGAKSASKMAAGASQSVDAVVAGSSCSSSQKTGMARGNHDCDACAELAVCDDELTRIGIETQVVPLKNGIMIVYTSTGKGKAQAIQNAMSRRHDRLDAVTASGEKAKLCPECKAMRGAMASGKLTRETVNIGGGVMTVMTSNDPKMVAKLQTMAASSKT